VVVVDHIEVVVVVGVEEEDGSTVNVVVAEVGVAHEVVVVDNIEVVVVVGVEEEDGSTDSGCVVANNNVEVVADAVVAIVAGAVGWHIDLAVAVQKSIYWKEVSM